VVANAAPRQGDVYLSFNGLGNYVEIPSTVDYSIATTGELAVAAWIRPDTLNFPRWERTGYVHWLGKGEGAGDGGQQEWVFRIYNRDHTTENPPRPNRISFYVFNPDGRLGVGSYFQDTLQEGKWMFVVVSPTLRAPTSIGTDYFNGVTRIAAHPMTNARSIFSRRRTTMFNLKSIRPWAHHLCALGRAIAEASSWGASRG
jgi:hypothetical protein